jgi:glycosyltransferase involved in cell wall biosynthesis
MRVAYVCADPGVPVFGRKGCSVHVQEVVRSLTRSGAAVTLIAARAGGAAPAELETLDLQMLPSRVEDDPAGRERAGLAANELVNEVLELEGPFDLAYERYSLWSHAGMEYARASGIPGVLEVNAPLIEEQLEHRGLIDRATAEWVAERAFGAATVLLAVSSEVAAYLEERFPAARGRVRVLPNGVNPDRFPAGTEAASPAPRGVFTVGFLGTLKPWHGLGVLAEAFAALHRQAPASRLLVVGDGPERASLAADLCSHGVAAAADFTGAVEPSQVPGLLASMDVGVAPYEEGHFYFSPLKVYEYMAAGLPVVASRIGQLSGLIRDGVTGVLCPPGDPAALAGALDRLRLDPARCLPMGKTARAEVLREHTWDARVGRILELAGLGAVHSPLASTRL